jgi:hypothetical protein
MASWRVAGGLVVLVLLALVGVDTRAQEATPAAAPFGIVREPLPAETVSQGAGNVASLQLERVQFQPGATLTLGADEAQIVVLVVEEGALEVQSPSPLTIQRVGATGEEPLVTESISPRTNVALETGDRLVSLVSEGMQLRQAGDQPTRLLHIGVELAPGADSASVTTEPRESRGLVLALAVVEPLPCPPGTEPGSPSLAATPGAGGGGGGSGGVAIALAAAPACIDIGATPVP